MRMREAKAVKAKRLTLWHEKLEVDHGLPRGRFRTQLNPSSLG